MVLSVSRKEGQGRVRNINSPVSETSIIDFCTAELSLPRLAACWPIRVNWVRSLTPHSSDLPARLWVELNNTVITLQIFDLRLNFSINLFIVILYLDLN